MKLPRVPIGLIAILLLVPAVPATAQYMYLDSNGDGIHTAADQVNPSGPTTVEIWLDTDSNRDGSPAVCSTGESMSMNSYAVGLRATGGSITWGSFLNRQSSMTHGIRRESDTEFMDEYYGFTYVPPGLYHLATLQLTVSSGTPAIQIVENVSIHFDATSFGSPCIGGNFQNTIELGVDWFDADGLPFGIGGSPNAAPLLAQPTDMAVPVGERISQALGATDADRQPVTFSKVSGPAYVTVATMDVGGGSAIGKAFVAPLVGDIGPAPVVVSATDGIATDQKSFTITVTSGPNHPPTLAGPGEINVVAGTSKRLSLAAIDPDGQALAFSKVAGPDFAEISTLSSGPGAASGSLRLTPALCDAGPSTITVGMTDGTSTQQVSLSVEVRIPSKATPSPPPYPVPSSAEAIATADLNLDGHLDIVTASGLNSATISVLLGRGDGSLSAAVNSPVPGQYPSCIAVGDLNRDGRPDLAVTMRSNATVVILIGRGDGSFSDGVALTVGPSPEDVKMADFNSDGKLDLAVANRTGTTVSLLDGTGDGTFAAKRDIDVGSQPYALAVADFNRDGRLDLASANFSSRTVAICLGFGDGTFGDRHEIPVAGAAFGIVAADWNWDGKMDLGVSLYEVGKVVILLGDGDGAFNLTSEITGFQYPQSIAAEDMNGDGNLDILIGDPSTFDLSHSTVEIAYGSGNGTFGSRRRITAWPAVKVATADINADGFPDAILGGGDQLAVWLNDAGGNGAAEARAILNKPDRIVRSGGPGARTCMSLEPVNGSYRSQDLNFGSITLRSEGTGSISQVPAIFPKTAEERDVDHNGVPELPVCFARADLAKLFDGVQGKQTVTAHLEGALFDGRRFCTNVALDVSGGHHSLVASITPNPLNPQARLKFSTSQDGFVRIRMFDLNGRLVRTLLDHPLVVAGDHQVVIDGRGGNGEPLASGIYFYQVEAQEGTFRGRFTVMK